MNAMNNRRKRTKFRGLFLDPEVINENGEFSKLAVICHLIYSLTGLVAGLVIALGGVILFLYGIAGNTRWAISMLAIDSELSDAAPGTILFVVGLLVVCATRFDIRSKKCSKR
jgi:hypothetical protein